MNNQWKQLLKKRQKGQILVLMGLIFIGLVAVIGLVVDLGMVFVSYSRLNRAVDAAALAATGEFKRNYTTAGLVASATQLLALNQVTLTNSDEIKVETCRTTPGDSELCTTPPKKLVRVTVKQKVPLYFLGVVGYRTFPIQVKALSEAARIDVVLITDVSGSMAADAPPLSPWQDAKICNEADQYGTDSFTPAWDHTPGPDGVPGECHPLEEMKAAALLFVDQLDLDYDRMGIVTFDRMPHVGEAIGGGGTYYSGLPLSSNRNQVIDAVKAIDTYEGLPGGCPFYSSTMPTANLDLEPCRLYRDDSKTVYEGIFCPPNLTGTGNPSTCTTTNLGGGIAMAANALAGLYPSGVPFLPAKHEDALWATIVLSDGNANAAYDDANKPICPAYTWYRNPKCRDRDSGVRHSDLQTSLYDADDYARDMTDILAGNNAIIYSIGLGEKTLGLDPSSAAPAPGEALLKYAAVTKGGGVYYYAPGGDQLAAIFLAIANNIATRLTQ